MWNISVEPMPSSSSTPVTLRHASQVAAGSGSAADTPRRSAPRSKRRARSGTPSMSRYDVGAQKPIVTRRRAKVSSMDSGENGGPRTVEAPNRKGKTSRPPVPNVKASVGWPPNRSSSVGRRTWRA